ncbi:hypothetical protein ONE63_003669 [Megalurothrips usitatus]|uniref:Uncharacterized protein n=1 Tax=Megalurothrips usitatus TaxID=439358 RepID=A0AAV7X7Z2_9NEOP|nr:hypothetical protein ONE63_003669 [Megalurothrips usitatus]
MVSGRVSLGESALRVRGGPGRTARQPGGRPTQRPAPLPLTLSVLAGGEADGEPEAGRTWVESLAHWFAHGIKRILVRISGGNPDEAGAGGEGEEGEDDGAPEPGANPDDGDWRDPASARTPKHLPRPAPAPRAPPPPPPPASSAPATPAPTTPPSPPTARPPNVIPSTATSKTRRPVVTTPSNMVYDDEAFDDGKPTKPARPVEETNELS